VLIFIIMINTFKHILINIIIFIYHE
jgi:hypothetical protein